MLRSGLAKTSEPGIPRCSGSGKLSNVLKNNFFTVSRELVEGGHLGALSGSAVKLYIMLMMLAQKHSAVEIQIPAYIAFDFAGLTANTVTRAGRELVAAGLVTCKAGEHGRTGYVLLDPKTRLPLPAPEGRRGVFRQPPAPGRSATARKPIKPMASTETHVPAWDEIGKTEAPQNRHRNTFRAAESQKLGSLIPKIAHHDPKNCEPRTAEAFEKEGFNASLSSLKTTLKRGISEEQGEAPRKKSSSEDGIRMSPLALSRSQWEARQREMHGCHYVDGVCIVHGSTATAASKPLAVERRGLVCTCRAFRHPHHPKLHDTLPGRFPGDTETQRFKDAAATDWRTPEEREAELESVSERRNRRKAGPQEGQHSK
jgi:hypothetical protein